MGLNIVQIALVVREYDEAIAWYRDRLGFVVVEDREVPEQRKRWVVMAPSADASMRLLLARAANPEQASRIGNQTGGRVFLFVHTDDFMRDHAAFRARGVHFIESPRHEPYGSVAVFEDLYGNRWDLIEPRQPT
jgi:catechol 2,3-dioxygenase-like lactoylglutathione lyase family enzyme